MLKFISLFIILSITSMANAVKLNTQEENALKQLIGLKSELTLVHENSTMLDAKQTALRLEAFFEKQPEVVQQAFSQIATRAAKQNRTKKK